ncbi:hypothetical protein EB796_005891 [Bugula neritina]|uniref:Uncharacterized protein n=1 Tax=Bugula neritina TaxID=10212 RepID=A0A7J7KAW5_BUGNE|nr:hypothetical protein EB796_005891 [Bugula neritina]
MSNSLKHHRSLRTIADGDIHWGRAVSLDTECYHCGLPLLHDKMDVTVFQCGHVTHQHCLSSSFVCSQCPSTN